MTLAHAEVVRSIRNAVEHYNIFKILLHGMIFNAIMLSRMWLHCPFIAMFPDNQCIFMIYFARQGMGVTKGV